MIQEITAAGIEAMAKVLSSGSKVEFTRCAVGCGTFNPQTMDAKGMTQLISQTASKGVTSVRSEPGGVAVVADMDNDVIPGGSKVAEMGVFAKAGGSEFLFAYAYTQAPETVPPKEQSTYERRFVTHVAMSDEEAALTVTFSSIDDAMAGLADVARTGDYGDLGNKPDLSLKQDRRVAVTAALSASGWSGLSQQVALPAATPEAVLVVSPAPESAEAWGRAGVYAASQTAGKVTFMCRKVPTADLTANVVVLA